MKKILVAVILMIVLAYIVFDRVNEQSHKRAAMRGRTEGIINCIECSAYHHLDVFGKFTATLEEVIQEAALGEGCEPFYSAVVADDIRNTQDAWGRKLSFAKRTLENGIVEVTIRSLGENGRLDTRDGHAVFDDVRGMFYLDPREVNETTSISQ